MNTSKVVKERLSASNKIDKKKKQSMKKIWLSRCLYTIGGAAICAAIIIPVMLTQCKNNENGSFRISNDNSVFICGKSGAEDAMKYVKKNLTIPHSLISLLNINMMIILRTQLTRTGT